MNLRIALLLSQIYTAASASASSVSLRGAVHERELDARIIGGTEAIVDRYNYAVSLQDDVAHFCGGSMLGPDTILSAAHCAQQNAYNVVIHRHDLRDGTDGEVRRVVRQILHPQYNPNVVDNDFMILILDKATEEDVDYVKVRPDVVGGNEPVTVVGWGDTDPSDGVALPPELMETEVFTLSNEECRQSEGQVGGTSLFGFVFGQSTESYRDKISDNMICARDNGEDSCQGDSGGPMVVKSDDGDEQVGVVSWGFGCANVDFPGVYARVSAQYDWIEDTVCEYSSSPPAYMECSGATAAAQTQDTGSGTTSTESTPEAAADEGWTTLLVENFSSGLGLFDHTDNVANHYVDAMNRTGVVSVGDGEMFTSNQMTIASPVEMYKLRFSFYAILMEDADDLCVGYEFDDGDVTGEKCWSATQAFENDRWYDDRSIVFAAPSGASSLKISFTVKGDESDDKVLVDSVAILGQ